MAKQFKISSVDYEFCANVLLSDYSQSEGVAISEFMSDWTDFALGYDKKHQTKGFNPDDAYCYVDSIDELIPPKLTFDDRQRFIRKLKKNLVQL